MALATPHRFLERPTPIVLVDDQGTPPLLPRKKCQSTSKLLHSKPHAEQPERRPPPRNPAGTHANT